MRNNHNLAYNGDMLDTDCQSKVSNYKEAKMVKTARSICLSKIENPEEFVSVLSSFIADLDTDIRTMKI